MCSTEEDLRDNLRDGMVCTMRDGEDYVYGAYWFFWLDRSLDESADFEQVPYCHYSARLENGGDPDRDIMAIKYGGKTVFKREETPNK